MGVGDVCGGGVWGRCVGEVYKCDLASLHVSLWCVCFVHTPTHLAHPWHK